MGKLIDLTGQRFGRLIVVKRMGSNSQNKPLWSGQCDCGNTVIVAGSHLRIGHTKSCGCLMREASKERATKHGFTRTRFYQIWKGMRQRCLNPNNPSYKIYGGREIGIYREWGEFAAFKKDMHESYLKHVEKFGEKNTTIDRTDGSKSYSPENYRWATYMVQGSNTRQNTLLTFGNESKYLSEWARKVGIQHQTISRRLKDKNKTIKEILYTPLNRGRMLTYKGKTQNIADWSRELEIPYQRLYQHLYKGVELSKAFNN